MRATNVAAIEKHMADYCGKYAVLVPSGRLAIYIALRCFLKPGSKVLMSPVNDDVVFFTVLAAGVKPVMAPVSSITGNIDPSAVTAETWSNVSAVLTTNLHGLPDQMEDLIQLCQQYNVLLIEDVAHALGVTVNRRPIGSFGQIAAFSFSKHLDVQGGMLCVDTKARLPDVCALRDRLVCRRPATQQLDDFSRPLVKKLSTAIGVSDVARSVKQYYFPPESPARVGCRMALRPERLEAALSIGPGLDSFESWVRVDEPGYRTALSKRSLKRILSKLSQFDNDSNDRILGVKKLLSLEVAAPILGNIETQAFLRVPLLVKKRDEIARQLQRNGFPVSYIYHPSLDEYAGPSFVTPPEDPAGGHWWSSHVLPIDPLIAHRFLNLVNELDIHLKYPEELRP